ncbi:MAG: ribonuclease III [Chitinophagales bacterium]
MSFIRKAYNTVLSDDKELVRYIRAITGITPTRLKWYKQTFNHRSVYGDARENNERLELLGDSVLDMLVAEFLFKKYPYREEGFITEMRSKLVNRKSLNAIADKLGLPDKIKMNKRQVNGMPKDIGGNTFEALIGALYLDAGIDATRKFIFKRVLQHLVDVEEVEATDVDFKSKIYHYVQREAKGLEFRVAEEQQRNRRSYFVIDAVIDGEAVGRGEGFSKKIAEQQAAMRALQKLQTETPAS